MKEARLRASRRDERKTAPLAAAPELPAIAAKADDLEEIIELTRPRNSPARMDEFPASTL
jgi:hypothetical protein